MSDTVLELRGVGRVFPRDIADVPQAILRDMFLPRRMLGHCPPTYFHALQQVNLALERSARLGILGLERSGKSTLASIAAGRLAPTEGSVQCAAQRLLMARPMAGFKHGLTVQENLVFRARLQGVPEEALESLVERALDWAGMAPSDALRPVGNLSPQAVKQAAAALVLQVPAEVTIFDEPGVMAAGSWALRGRLLERAQIGPTLVVGGDPGLIGDMVDQACVLHGGRLYGPFDVARAIDLFSRIPYEDAAPLSPSGEFDPLAPPWAARAALSQSSNASADAPYANDDDGLAPQDEEREPRSLRSRAPWRVADIRVDDEEFRHAHLSLLRPPGTLVRLRFDLCCDADADFTGGLFTLHGGSTGLERARLPWTCASRLLQAGEQVSISCEFIAPDGGEDFYGLTFCPSAKAGEGAREGRLKLLIFGVGRKHARPHEQLLDLRVTQLEREPGDACFDAVSERQQAARQMGQSFRCAPAPGSDG